ncbi:SH3 domain-containing protein [Paracoccus luteus]|uniref:SH3 domain-containing protein n=1 Tax=Paracoccus luteus TaxID=2508543 RepID=UPI00106FC20A|nr:SH3 domain-containing protein [Paracoccus luteus]
MIRALLLATLTALAVPVLTTPALATPTLYDVTGVSAGDVLNIRAEPNARARIVGTLPANARGFEVSETSANGWARIHDGTRTGWVNARYLVRAAPVAAPQLTCLGTEPFWSLTRFDDTLTWTTPDTAPRAMTLRAGLTDGLDPVRTQAMIGGDAAGRVTAVIRSEQCSDGMSDQRYPLGVTVLLDGSGQATRMLTGCCRVGP